MEFEITRTITIEYPKENLNVELNDLEKYLNENLLNKNYGNSVTKYFWGFELFKYDGSFSEFFGEEIESWKHSSKWFVTNSSFDWNLITKLNHLETLELIKTELISSIYRIDKMKRKPKDFDYTKFVDDIEILLKKYTEKNILQHWL